MFGKVVMGAHRVRMFMSVGIWSWEQICLVMVIPMYLAGKRIHKCGPRFDGRYPH